MATSPNYAWAEPDNSSLVKNGASDIRTLGDAIDTSVWNVGYGQAGKNKFINADFGIWQRGTTATDPSGGSYLADRFRVTYDGTAPTSRTYSQQIFALGTAPVAGYEGKFFGRLAITTKGSNTKSGLAQYIEGVRTFAGQTVTISFWAKCDSARTGSLQVQQYFGQTGSPSATVTVSDTSLSYTTSWARYSVTMTFPSIAGKTLGTAGNDAIYVNFYHNSADGSTFDIWGVQAEYGSKATPFQTASGGSLQGELAMCQRYFVRFGLAAVSNSFVGQGGAISTTLADITLTLPVQQRVGATSITYSGLQLSDRAGSPIAVSSVAQLVGDAGQQTVEVTVASGLTQYRNYWMQQTASTSFLAFNAEL
jgi:hypothetical protein